MATISRWLCLLAVITTVCAETEFDLTLYHREVNHASMETSIHPELWIQEQASLVESRLRFVLDDNSLRSDVYDVIESGIDTGSPTVSLRLRLFTSRFSGRESFVKAWEAADTGEFLLFSVGLALGPAEGLGLLRLHERLIARANGECLNRGFMLPNNTCVCPAYYSGSDCSTQTCLNSGIISTNFRCTCPPGYVGRHCEQMGCMSAFDSEFDFSTRTFSTVFNIKTGMSFLLSRVQLAIMSVLADRAGYYSNYMMTIYYKSGTVDFSHVYAFNDVNAFMAQMSNVYPNDGDTTQPTINAIKTAMMTQSTIHAKTDIYVFSNSLPSDASTAMTYQETATSVEALVTRTAINWGHSINIILAQFPGTPFNASSASIDAFRRLARASNGQYIFVGDKSSDAGTAFKKLYALNYYPETIFARYGFDCTNPASIPVSIGPFDAGLFVFTTGAGITLSSNGNNIAANSSFGDFQVFVVSSDVNVLTTLSVSGATDCGIRVFTSSKESMVLGFSNSDIVDVSSSYAISNGVPNMAVGRIAATSQPNTMSFEAVSASDPTASFFNAGNINATRSTCNFPFLFSANLWTGCTPGPFFAKTTYTDAKGVATRFLPGLCLQPDFHDPSTAPITCNGGTIKNTTCICPPYQSGTYCEQTVCMNGGTPQDFPGNGRPNCYCLPGYSGNHCENLSCASSASRPDTSRTSFSLVLQTTISAAFATNQVKTAIQKAVVGAAHPDYFTRFLLTTFANKTLGISVESNVYGDANQFLTAMGKLTGGVSGDDQTQNAFGALISALNTSSSQPNPYRQSLFLIVDSVPGDWPLMNDAIARAVDLATAVNVIALKPYGWEGDSSIKCIENTTFYQAVAQATGGFFVDLCTDTKKDSISSLMIALTQANWQLQWADWRKVPCFDTVSINVENLDSTLNRVFVVTSPVDVKYNAVLRAPDGTATTLNSSVTAFGLDVFQTSQMTQNGSYTFTVSPASNTPMDIQCTIAVGEQVGMAVLVGLAADPSVDSSSLVAQYGVPAHLSMFVSTQLQSTPNVSLTVTGDNDYSYSANGILRDTKSCSFDYYFPNTFSCPKSGAPLTITARFTTDTVSFNRVISSFCAPLEPGHCLNGGYTDTGVLCTCPPAFEGINCETPICFNNGTVKQDVCSCPPGTTGSHCEMLTCSSWNYLATHNTNSFAHETIAFVVSTNIQMAVLVANLNSTIESFVNNVNSKDHQKQFILVTYDESSVDKVLSTTDPVLFMNTVAGLNVTTITFGPIQVLQAIAAAVDLITYKPAIMYVFSGGDMTAPGSEMMRLLGKIGEGGIEVNHIIFPLGTPNLNAGNNIYFLQTAVASGGRIVYFNVDAVSNLMSQYLPATVFENAIIEDKIYSQCSTPQMAFFPVENRARWITLNIRGNNVSKANPVQIWDGANQFVGSPSKFLSIVSDNFVAYTFHSTDNVTFPGLWKVQVQTDKGTCQMQIRAATNMQTSVGFTTDPHDDNAHNQIFSTGSGQSVVLTLGVNAKLYSQNEAFLEYVSMRIVSADTGTSQLAMSTPLMARNGDRCASQFVTPFFNMPKVSGVTIIQVQVNGQDEFGQNFQQIKWYQPPKPSCNNGNTLSGGFCTCNAQFTDDFCSTPVCQNGGTPDMSVCQCASGYYGTFCESPVRSNSSTNPSTPSPTAPAPATSTTQSATTTSQTPSTTAPPSTPAAMLTSPTAANSSPGTTTAATASTSQVVPSSSAATISTSAAAPSTTPSAFSTATVSATNAATSSVAPTGTAVPPPPTVKPNCTATSLDLFLRFAFDNSADRVGTVGTFYRNVLNTLTSSPTYGNGITRTLGQDYTSGAGNSSTDDLAFNDTNIVISLSNAMRAGINDMTASLGPALTRFQQTAPPPTQQLVPTLVLFTKSPVTDLAAAKSLITALRTSRRAYIFLVELSTHNDFSDTVFDGTRNVVNMVGTDATAVVNDVLDLVCSVTSANFNSMDRLVEGL